MKAKGKRQKAKRNSLEPEQRRINRAITLALYLTFAFCALPFAFCLLATADQTITNQPAAEGRPITPAGTLLLDATTRQPAVSALPVDFVRSPDAAGAGGRGRRPPPRRR